MNYTTSWSTNFLILFSFTALLFSCDESTSDVPLTDTIQNSNLEIHYKEISLPMKNTFIDSLRTDNVSELYVGKYNDPTFGVVTASSFINFSPDFENFNDRINDVGSSLDSAILTIKISNVIGDTYASKFGFRLFSLEDTLKSDLVYLSSYFPAYNENTFGQVSASFYQEPDIDTANVYQYLRIKLTGFEVNNIFQLAKEIGVAEDSSENYSHNAGFALLSLDDAQSIAVLNPADDSTSLMLYFNTPGYDSLTFGFSLSGGVSCNHFSVDRTETVFNDLSPGIFDPIDDKAFLHSVSMFYPVIELNTFEAFTDSLSALYPINQIQFNKIEVSLDLTDFRPDTNSIIQNVTDLRFAFETHSGLLNGVGIVSDPFHYSIMSNNAYLGVIGSGLEKFDIGFDSENYTFSGNNTLFFQNLMRGSFTTDFGDEFTFEDDAYPNRLIIIGEDDIDFNKSIFDANSAKIKISYTIIQ